VPQSKPVTPTLPLVLAGPIVRRAEPSAIYIWVCLSEKLDLGVRVYKGRANATSIVPNQTYASYKKGLSAKEQKIPQNVRQIGEGKSTKPVQIGTKLFCHLIEAKAFVIYPCGVEISYEVFVLNENKHFAYQLFEPHERAEFTIDGSSIQSPSFALQRDEPGDLRLAFGSCRKLHGKTKDMTTTLFDQLFKNRPASTRPNTLFLLGDQIYADDVSALLIQDLNKIGQQLVGEERLPQPYPGQLNGKEREYRLNTTNDRQKDICYAANFTSDDAANHLATLGEYCSMYLLTFGSSRFLDNFLFLNVKQVEKNIRRLDQSRQISFTRSNPEFRQKITPAIPKKEIKVSTTSEETLEYKLLLLATHPITTINIPKIDENVSAVGSGQSDPLLAVKTNLLTSIEMPPVPKIAVASDQNSTLSAVSTPLTVGVDRSRAELNLQIEGWRKRLTPEVQQSIDDLQNARKGTEAFRRILANTPTYMLLDDHEITDDFNITPEWDAAVSINSLGTQIVKNGMIAYWFFQGWGNDPAADKSQSKSMTKMLSGGSSSFSLSDLKAYPMWSFLAPTNPVALFLDTRMSRQTAPFKYFCEVVKNGDGTVQFDKGRKVKLDEFPIPNYNGNDLKSYTPLLISDTEYAKWLVALGQKYVNESEIIICTPSPVFGLKVTDKVKELAFVVSAANGLLMMQQNPVRDSFMVKEQEDWSSNPYSVSKFIDFASRLPIGNKSDAPIKVTMLSGDIHYSFNKQIEMEVEIADSVSLRKILFDCYTSSAIKNVPPAYPWTSLAENFATLNSELKKLSTGYSEYRYILDQNDGKFAPTSIGANLAISETELESVRLKSRINGILKKLPQLNGNTSLRTYVGDPVSTAIVHRNDFMNIDGTFGYLDFRQGGQKGFYV
jgi:hypothetical protein